MSHERQKATERDLPAEPAVILVGIDPALDKHGVGVRDRIRGRVAWVNAADFVTDPEETNGPYGIAKKALLVMLQAYRTQYDFHGVYLLPVNLYGPRDNFSLESSHVIPALIRKCIEARDAGESEIVCWGTGDASREFLYVDDCAEAIATAVAEYDDAEPVNIGTGREITIRVLAELIARLTGFDGRIRWDATRPDGQPRRCLDVSRARERFGFEARTDLETGLRHTIEWYEKRTRSPSGRG